MFKKARCLLLPTKEKAPIILGITNKLFSNDSESRFRRIQNATFHHLYIISADEEIIKSNLKIGDYIHTINIPIEQVKEIIKDYSTQRGYEWLIITNNGNQYKPIEIRGKVIASTDKLALEPYMGHYEGIDCTNYLPQPSQSFIEKYITEYNKGSVIENVLVEYEFDWSLEEDTINFPNLKVNPKDNTISIKKVKDSWSREELSEETTSFMKRWHGVLNQEGIQTLARFIQEL